ncbi:MAG: hypothetical protein OEU46_18575 [Alphaproteobacteria bacterium]|nr:hypothetical protein [Alphaproteobacteria bacterium]
MDRTHGTIVLGRLIGRSSGRMLIPLLDRVWLWRDRAAERKMLARFDDRALQDIAVDRATAFAEAAKPFWRA